MNNNLFVQQPGLFTTIQDAGRVGFRHLGFSTAGALDLPSFYMANLLVGNPKNTPALEMTLQGGVFRFGAAAHIALTGADMNAQLNEVPVPTYQTIAVPAGSVLACKSALVGMRAYLAVAGGFALEPAMGSFATSAKLGIGGAAGRPLQAGDALPLQAGVIAPPLRQLPVPAHLNRLKFEEKNACLVLRAIAGPQQERFSHTELQRFFRQPFQILPASDRMGLRLFGHAITSIAGVDILSDGIVPGSVQVPPSGQPIVMLADCQTIGGYAKIATVITVDLPLLAQAKPTTFVRFAPIKIKAAQSAHKAHKKRLHHLEYQFLSQP